MTETVLPNFLPLTAEIVASYVARNSVPPNELAKLIRGVFDGIVGATSVPTPASDVLEAQKPAVPIKRSISDDHIVCLEDGGHFSSLKRHLMSEHGMTPDQYRSKWRLPGNYPMVAPEYARERSELARRFGLGTQRVKPKAT